MKLATVSELWFIYVDYTFIGIGEMAVLSNGLVVSSVLASKLEVGSKLHIESVMGNDAWEVEVTECVQNERHILKLTKLSDGNRFYSLLPRLLNLKVIWYLTHSGN